MQLKIDRRYKYNKVVVQEALRLLGSKLCIREIAKIIGVPETTIRNWKFGYSDLYRTNRKLNGDLKQKVVELLNNGHSIPEIAKKLKVNYDSIRLFLKKKLSEEEYSFIKSTNRRLLEESKLLTPELSYILGVMYGDGHFGVGQIRLGTKDKDFINHFMDVLERWCNKQPSQRKFMKYNKPYYECYLSFKDATTFIKKVIGDRTVIPTIIQNSNDPIIMTVFIKGFSDSEGTIVTQKNGANFLKIYNQKKLVLHQIKDMFLKLGFDENKVYIAFNNKAKNGDVYAIRMCYKDQLKLFYEKIGFTIQRKQQKLAQ